MAIMSGKPTVSVIMSVYNEEKHLRLAIDSILEQSFSDFEFIIIDDCSTDNSRKILSDYEDMDRVKIQFNQENKGITKNLNKGIQVSDGKFIARQDADDISSPERLEKQVSFLSDNEGVGLIGSNVTYIDDNGNEIGYRDFLSAPAIDDLRSNGQFIHGSIMIRKKVINTVGIYDELFEYSQDYEYILRVANEFKCRNLQERLYKYRKSDDRIGANFGNEQRLYFCLARMKMDGKLTKEMIQRVKTDGINVLPQYLPDEELYKYHRSLGLRKLNINDYDARRHLWECLNLSPYRPSIYLALVLSFLPETIYDLAQSMYNQYWRSTSRFNIYNSN